jgi:hypothetical protein
MGLAKGTVSRTAGTSQPLVAEVPSTFRARSNTNRNAWNTIGDGRFARHVTIDQEIPMNKLLTSTLLAASLIAAPAIAFAQSETTAPPATKSEATAPKTTHHAMKSTHMKKGTTTGMSSTSRTRPGGESVARKPAY